MKLCVSGERVEETKISRNKSILAFDFRDEVELFNLQLALILRESIVLWLNSERQLLCLLISAQLEPLPPCPQPAYLKGIVSSMDAHFTESTNQ